MQPRKTAVRHGNNQPAERRVFTPDDATRALVLVRPVVRDIVEAYGRLLDLRARREELAITIAESAQLEVLREQIERGTERLRELQDELTDIGCELKDWVSGLVDFPALHEGRMVWLCWRLGEPSVEHWHEWYSGFSGRQPVRESFGAPEPPPAPEQTPSF